MEGYACDVPGVAFERKQGVRVRRFDIVELDGVVAGRGQESLVWGDAQSIDLRIWVLYGSRADSGEGLPESKSRQYGWFGQGNCPRRREGFQQTETLVPDGVVVTS